MGDASEAVALTMAAIMLSNHETKDEAKGEREEEEEEEMVNTQSRPLFRPALIVCVTVMRLLWHLSLFVFIIFDGELFRSHRPFGG